MDLEMIEVEEFNEQFLTCPICQCVYEDPVTLQCHHTYCRKCLTDLIQSRRDAIRDKIIPCPLHCQGTVVPDPQQPVVSWTKQIRPSYLITNLMDEFRQFTVSNCVRCEAKGTQTLAVKWCPMCRQSLCEGCITNHRRDPTTKLHALRHLPKPSEKTKQQYVECDNHGEHVKLFCDDCNKAICNTCCSLHHSNCKSVVLIDTKLEHMQSTVLKYKAKLEIERGNKSINITRFSSTRVDELGQIKRDCQSQIRSTFQQLIEILKEKESSHLKQLEKTIETEIQTIQELVQSNEVSLQMYQQRYHFIEQAFKSGSVSDIYNIYQSSLSADESGWANNNIQSQHRDVLDVRFTVNINHLTDAMNNLDFGTLNVQYERSNVPHVSFTSPVLAEVIMGKCSSDKEDARLHDITVLDIDGVQTVIVTDWDNKCLKSFYTRNSKSCQNKLTLGNYPHGITQLNNNKIMVTVPFSHQIITVEVTPDLVLLSTIKTSKKYYGLAVIRPNVFAAGSDEYVDLIDTGGIVMKTISTHNGVKHFQYTNYMCVSKGNLFVSDCGNMSVTCLTSEGDVVWTYAPTGDEALRYPRGITSTTTGEFLFVDRGSQRVIQLTESGQYLGDILTKQNGLRDPQGIYVDKDNSLFVGERETSGKIKHFAFT